MKKRTVVTLGAVVVLSACSSATQTMSSAQPMIRDTGRPVPREAVQKQEATPDAVRDNFMALSKSRRRISEDWSDRSFEEFEATVAREQGTGFYIVNGDIVIKDRKQLEAFFEENVRRSESVSTGLIMHKPGGTLAKWDEAQKRNLSYCVSNSFGSRHARVVADMQAAAAAWSGQGDVVFVYAPEHDDNCNAFNNQVVFDTRPVNSGDYLARAFFPDDARSSRNVLIDDSSFNTSGNLTLLGILRHELGHVLGFRHEHTRPESGTCFEDDEWEPLTDYDAFSVMHYPQCNGAGDWSLALTDDDKNGMCRAYGAGPGFDGSSPGVCAASVVPVDDDPLDPSCQVRSDSTAGAVERGESDNLGSFAVARGETLTVAMGGTGDPDLYVRFGAAPTESSYDCRPYRSGPNETCTLDVPADTTAQIMVRGFAAGTYQLDITVEEP